LHSTGWFQEQIRT